jgi:hypothetical protein
MDDVTDAITFEAISNCALRLAMPCRRAIQWKSVYTAHTVPVSSCVTNSRTG